MIWKRKASVEQLNSLGKNTILAHLDIRVLDIGPDYIIASMPVDSRTTQPEGLLHGGASCVLAESLGSLASVLMVDESKSKAIVGIEINANHLRAVRSGRVTGKVSPIKIGRRIHVWQIKIHDEKERLACISRLTIMVS